MKREQGGGERGPGASLVSPPPLPFLPFPAVMFVKKYCVLPKKVQ